MKKIILVFFLILFSGFVLSQDDPKLEKKYTEEDFQKKLNEEVLKKIDDVKNKSISDMTKEVLEREKALKIKEIELMKKEEELKASEKEISKKALEFQEKQKEFIACLDRNKQDEGNRISQLVDMISNMKPQKAAEILSVQDEVVAVQIIQAIDSKKASKIFNFMEKDISAKLQKQYLEMKR